MKRILLLSIVFITLITIKYAYRTKKEDRREAEHELETEMSASFKFLAAITTRDGAPTFDYEVGYRFKEIKKSQAFFTEQQGNARALSNGVIEWNERGPHNLPGRTRTIFNVPGDATENTWLAGSAGGGIWKTTDGGSSWREVSQGFDALSISGIDGSDDGSVIYASTGEYMGSFFTAVGNGIWKSMDLGETWEPLSSTINNSDFAVCTRLIVNPANGDEILAAATDRRTGKTGGNGFILRSTDGGATWYRTLTTDGVIDQIIDTPGNFLIQYASERGAGVWKSTDGGLTWTLNNVGMSPVGRTEIAVSPSDPTVLYAASVGNKIIGTKGDLYHSNNSAESWQLVNVSWQR